MRWHLAGTWQANSSTRLSNYDEMYTPNASDCVKAPVRRQRRLNSSNDSTRERETERERDREINRMGSACSRLSTVFNTLAATTTTANKHNLLRVFVCDVFIFNNTVLHN